MTGRPSLYSDELADRLCEELMMGRALREVCRTEPWAPSFRTVIRWLGSDDPKLQRFGTKYARARDVQTDVHADDIILIADTLEEGTVETDKFDKDGEPITEVRRADMLEHRKLRIAARQWTAEKLKPKKYGQRQTLEHEGGLSVEMRRVEALTADELIGEIMELLETGRLKLPDGIQLEVCQDDDDDPFGVG